MGLHLHRRRQPMALDEVGDAVHLDLHRVTAHDLADPRPITAVQRLGQLEEVLLETGGAWYRNQEARLANVERDMDALPALRTVVSTGRAAWEQAVRDILASGWKRGGRERQRLHGAIGLACSFGAWQRLARSEGLTESEVVEVLARLIEASAGDGPLAPDA